MTVDDVKNAIYERMIEVSKYATSADLHCLSSSLITLENIGKLDSNEKYFDAMLDTLKQINNQRFDKTEESDK